MRANLNYIRLYRQLGRGQDGRCTRMSSTTWRGLVLFSCKQFMYCKMQRFSTQRATLTVLLFCAVLLYLQLKSNGGTFWNANPQTVFKVNENSPLLKNVQNSTLGFEKIYAIGFKDRTDKRDAITLAGSVLDIDVDWIDGVDYKKMSPKAYPAAWTAERHTNKPADVGAWRAHMNVLQTIVQNKISSALILEDDVDFDVTLKTQLGEFARGTRTLQKVSPPPPKGTVRNINTDYDPSTEPPSIHNSPYGPDWEMLWLGYCGAGSREEQLGQPRRFYVIPHDPTVRPSTHHPEGLSWGPLFTGYPELQKHRVVFNAQDVVCSVAFAVTYEGARKALATFSTRGLDEPMDLSYRALCNGELGVRFRCMAPYPPLITSWRGAGPVSRDSDIVDDKGSSWHPAHSVGIVYSTMLNIVDLVAGSRTARAQWDDVEPLSIDPKTFKIPKGVLWMPDAM